MRTVIRLFTMSQLFDHLLHFAYRQYTVEPDRMMTCDRCQPVPLQILGTDFAAVFPQIQHVL